MPEYSTTIKSLAASAVGYEVFDLTENWKNIDHIIFNCMAGDSSGSLVTVDFADSPSTLNTTSELPFFPSQPVFKGVGVGQTLRYSSGSALSTVTAPIKVAGRYVRIRVANGSTAQNASSYIDVKGYTLES